MIPHHRSFVSCSPSVLSFANPMPKPIGDTVVQLDPHDKSKIIFIKAREVWLRKHNYTFVGLNSLRARLIHSITLKGSSRAPLPSMPICSHTPIHN